KITANGNVEAAAEVCLRKLPALQFETMIGPVPFWGAIVPTVSLGGSVAIEGKMEEEASVTASAHAEMGFEVKNGNFSPIADFDMHFTPEQHFSATLGFGVMLFLPVKFQLVLYNLPNGLLDCESPI